MSAARARRLNPRQQSDRTRRYNYNFNNYDEHDGPRSSDENNWPHQAADQAEPSSWQTNHQFGLIQQQQNSWGVASIEDPLFQYHRDYGLRYRNNRQYHHHHQQQQLGLQAEWPKPTRMTNLVVPWLVTMSLLGFQEFAEPAGLPGATTPTTSTISQNFPIAQKLHHRNHQPAAHGDSTTPNSSFDEPLFNQEEPPLTHVDCDFHSNLRKLAKPKSREHPHGFKIDARQSTTEQTGQFDSSTSRDQKNLRNLDNRNNEINGINSLSSGPPALGTASDLQDTNNLTSRFFTSTSPFPGGILTHDEFAGPAMSMAFHWKIIDFEFAKEQDRNGFIYTGTFIPENNLPLGLEVSIDRVFVSLPRWKKGIPATLGTFPLNSIDKSPKLQPYPSWDWHHLGNCQGLTSVFRMQIDDCNRLWVMDSGKIDIADKPKQICPPTLFIFDLSTDTLIRAYRLPVDQIKEDSLFTNIVVDTRPNQCEKAVAYFSDVFRYGLVVYDFQNDTSFRIQHPLFFPEPLSSKYNLHGLEFHWTDGIFGLALTPLDVTNEKTLFFHPLSSFREFAVPSSAIRTKSLADSNFNKFIPVGKPRAKDYGHSSGSTIDRDGVMFFNMVTRDSVWCWDTRKEYIPQNLGVIGSSNISLVFPNDIRVDHDLVEQNVWVLSNRLPMYLYSSLNPNEINFRILKASVKEAVKNTVCDPSYIVTEFDRGFDTC